MTLPFKLHHGCPSSRSVVRGAQSLVSALWASLTLMALSTYPSLAQGYINPPIYASGYITVAGGSTVNSQILTISNHPTDLTIYNSGAITTWNITLPNPTFDGQLIRITCAQPVTTLNVSTTDGSSQPIGSGLCAIGTYYTLQYTSRYNNWTQVSGSSQGGTVYNTPLGIDVRAFGAVADGITDNTVAFQTALNSAGTCVIVPATPLGFYIAGSITVTTCLRGAVWNPSPSTLSFANTSVILCNNQAAGPCVVVNKSSNVSAEVGHLTLLGSAAGDASAAPAPGSVGFQWQGGYNLQLRDIQIANFDTCEYFGPTAISLGNPITAHSYGTFLSRCQKHYVVDDGIPELYFIGGRFGENGGTDYNSADDFFYGTKTTDSGSGGGPNTVVFDSIQMNPGNKTVGCPFRWGGFAYSNGTFSSNKIANSHIEVLSGSNYTGSATQGIFCVDSTVPNLPGIQVVNSEFTEDGTKSLPLFNFVYAVKTALVSAGGSGYGASVSGTMTWAGGGCTVNPVLNVLTNGAGAITNVTSIANAGQCSYGPAPSVTTWTPGGGLSAGSGASFSVTTIPPWGEPWAFVNSKLCAGAFTLPIQKLQGSHVYAFDDDEFCSAATFQSGDGLANLTLSNNTFGGGYTVSGQWNNLVLNGNVGALTDNATGAVYESNQSQGTWTPTLRGSSTAGSFSYTTQTGTWTRTPGGGLWSYFSIALSSTSGAAGNVQIIGMPKSCGGRPAIANLSSYTGLTGLNGQAFAASVGGADNINLLEPGSGGTGLINIPASALTNSTSVTGTVTCGLAQ